MLNRNSKPRSSRLARRAALAALLASVAWQTNALAEQPGAVKLQLLPPLPVQMGQAEAADSQVTLRSGPHLNPYCQPQASVITLVSGQQLPSGLQPAAETVTLQPVGQADQALAPTDQPLAEDAVELVRPRTTMRLMPLPAPAAVQPVAASEPITFRLSDEAAERIFPAGPEAPEPTSPQTSDQPLEAAEPAELLEVEEADGLSESLPPGIALGAVRSAEPLELAEPVEMSLEDDADTRSSAAVQPLDAQDVADASPLATEVPAPRLTVESADPVSRIQTNELAEEPQPRVARRSTKPSEPLDHGRSNALNITPIVVEPGVALDPTASLVQERSGLVIDVPQEIDERIKNPAPATRARPVAGTADVPTAGVFTAPQPAVTPAPQAATTPAAAPAPQAAAAAQLPATSGPVASPARQAATYRHAATQAAAAQPAAERAPVTPARAVQAAMAPQASQEIEVGKAQMHALQIEGQVRCFAVEDETICQVLPAGLSALRVVGQRTGSTRLAVWVGDDAQAQPVIYNVHVDSGPPSELEGLSATADKLTQMLSTTFPDSRVRVQADDNRLIVRGVVVDDEQASRMLRLVRQTCLVPVVDHLTTR